MSVCKVTKYAVSWNTNSIVEVLDEFDIDNVDLLVSEFDDAICDIAETVEIIDELGFAVSNPNTLYNDDLYHSWYFSFNTEEDCQRYLELMQDLFHKSGCKINLFE